MTYTMVFVLSPDYRYVLLLQKPITHKNPLFRGRWTAPGGKLEDYEEEAEGAARELGEETQLDVVPEDLRYVLSFACNCDSTEPEHDVIVYGVIRPLNQMRAARGEFELVKVFNARQQPPVRFRIENALWTTEPLIRLVTGRMKQPV